MMIIIKKINESVVQRIDAKGKTMTFIQNLKNPFVNFVVGQFMELEIETEQDKTLKKNR